MRQLRFLALLLFLAVAMPSANAQQASSAVSSSINVRTVTLGNATVLLDGLWKFRTGDSPQANGTLAWAEPDFDDSGWGTMDLTPPPGSYNPTYGTSGFVPGWTDRGYKDYSGYAWYRLRVNIQDGQTALALKMPNDVDDAYQVYVNGQLIGQFGKFTARGVSTYFVLPRTFSLPANLQDGPTTIAIRMWMNAYTALIDPDVGGLHGPPVLGHASAIAGLLNLDWYAIDRWQYFTFFEIAILLLALVVAFALFWLDPSEPAYLWLGLVCADWLAGLLLTVVVDYTTWITVNTVQFLTAILKSPYTGLWVLFWAYWFRLRRMRLVHGAVWTLIAIAAACELMTQTALYGTVVPVHAIVWLSPLHFVRNILMGALFAWVIYRGIRRNRYEGLLAAPAVALWIVALYAVQLHISRTFFPFGIAVTVADAALIATLIAVVCLLLRRFLHGQRQREQWKLEIEQARSIQQVLIPSAEVLPAIAGFTIESEYRPAQQVGGDFFQIIRHPSDGSLLIVLGDVTGHGLKAAMLVSLLVGAIRDRAETGYEPLALLEALNRRLHGRGKVYATCLALRIQPDGSVALANAGHIPPFLNGNEIVMEGALPLGMVLDAKFTQMKFQLAAGDRLTLLTDGVLEATNENREMFGFARVSVAMREEKSAAEIAAAAQAFGQQDDITVLRIVREPVPEPALRPASSGRTADPSTAFA